MAEGATKFIGTLEGIGWKWKGNGPNDLRKRRMIRTLMDSSDDGVYEDGVYEDGQDRKTGR